MQIGPKTTQFQPGFREMASNLALRYFWAFASIEDKASVSLTVNVSDIVELARTAILEEPRLRSDSAPPV